MAAERRSKREWFRVDVISDVTMMSTGRTGQTVGSNDDDIMDDVGGSAKWLGDVIVDIIGSNNRVRVGSDPCHTHGTYKLGR